jgi:hypothetical protein
MLTGRPRNLSSIFSRGEKFIYSLSVQLVKWEVLFRVNKPKLEAEN